MDAAFMDSYGPSAAALGLQAEIQSTPEGVVNVPPGDYYFGNASLTIQRKSSFTLRGNMGVNIWFCIGAGVLVNQSSDIVLDGLVLDYDPPAHYQGTIVNVTEEGAEIISAIVQTDVGFLDPLVFNTRYAAGRAGVQTAAGNALVWNSSEGIAAGAYAPATWPPIPVNEPGCYIFNVSRASLCTDISATTSDGTSCVAGHANTVRVGDKITAHTRVGFTLHLLNSTRVHTQHTRIHGAPGFAITEYDGEGAHSYLNVSLGRRRRVKPPTELCGIGNPTGGRECVGMIASNNDGLHSSGTKFAPSFLNGEISYCLDDFINIHSRAQVVFDHTADARHMIIIDPRLDYAASTADEFPYGNVETLTNAREGDVISFFLSGNLSALGSATVVSTSRATWDRDAALVTKAQRMLGERFPRGAVNGTCGLDAGSMCRAFGCAPRVWNITFATAVPAFSPEASARGIVASLDSWSASGAVVTNSTLHHGRYGIRWKSSHAVIAGNSMSARYVEISPLEYYMEGGFRLDNITVADNIFGECAAINTFPSTACSVANLPLGYFRKWVNWGGGCGGVCKAASQGAVWLDPEACEDVAIVGNHIK